MHKFLLGPGICNVHGMNPGNPLKPVALQRNTVCHKHVQRTYSAPAAGVPKLLERLLPYPR